MPRSFSREVSSRVCRLYRGWVVGLLLLLASTTTHAGLSDLVLDIQVSNSQGSGSYQVFKSSLIWDPENQEWWWDYSDNIDIMDGTGLITLATITDLTLSYIQDPQVTFGFTVQAGAFDTTFSLTSGLLSFPALDPAEGLASAGLLITDTNSNGATLTGLHTGGGAYAAQYNGLAPGGTTFTELLTSSLIATTDGTNSANQEFPGGGLFAAIDVPVTNISAQFSFLLTAGDLASGSSNFNVVPAPGGVALLILMLTGVARKRRRYG